MFPRHLIPVAATCLVLSMHSHLGVDIVLRSCQCCRPNKPKPGSTSRFHLSFNRHPQIPHSAHYLFTYYQPSLHQNRSACRQIDLLSLYGLAPDPNLFFAVSTLPPSTRRKDIESIPSVLLGSDSQWWRSSRSMGSPRWIYQLSPALEVLVRAQDQHLRIYQGHWSDFQMLICEKYAGERPSDTHRLSLIPSRSPSDIFSRNYHIRQNQPET